MPTAKPRSYMHYSTDILIIGSGVAGLSLALHLPKTYQITLVAKNSLTESSSFYAQGGVAAATDTQTDSPAIHMTDTMIAGAGLSRPEVVQFVAEQAPATIAWLIEQGVPFTREDDKDLASPFHLAQEGGHSQRRIFHTQDATGKALTQTLTQRVKALNNVTFLDHHMAIDVVVTNRGQPNQYCSGAYLYDTKHHRIINVAARTVILATGGASKIYLYTTNPDVASGDGIAMAWRAGCRVANLEFNQFHPTCLYHPEARSLLLTEALRGEGAVLRLPDGTRFMPAFDERAELAPRDIVARAIDHEMKRLGCDHVYLDITHQPPEFIRAHFPMLYQRCLEYGLDMTTQWLPVVPAAHYTCGGVMTDLDGCTDIPQLYAIGEVACTGLHGANRMASNSLLECLVFAKTASNNIQAHWQDFAAAQPIPAWDDSRVSPAREEIIIKQGWEDVRRVMWNYVGIVRSNERLRLAQQRVALLQQEVHAYYSRFTITPDLLELRNLVQVASLMIQCALLRQENRGLHYNLDYINNPQHTTACDSVLPAPFKPQNTS